MAVTQAAICPLHVPASSWRSPALVGHTAEVKMVLHWQVPLGLDGPAPHLALLEKTQSKYFSNMRGLKAHKNKSFETECKLIC